MVAFAIAHAILERQGLARAADGWPWSRGLSRRLDVLIIVEEGGA